MPKKSSTFHIPFFTLIAALCILLCACGKTKLDVIDETQETGFRRGKSLLREGRNQEALNAFLKIIEKRKDAPESHMEAGILYLDHLQDPVFAIYHFRKYLETHKQGDQADVIRQLIETATKKFAAQLPGQPYGDGLNRVDMLGQIDKLQKENLLLKEQLLEISNQLVQVKTALRTEREFAMASGNNPAVLASEVKKPKAKPRQNTTNTTRRPPTQTTYTVKSGDTLSKISRKVYGTSGRWKEIFQANKDKIKNPSNVPLGVTLKIPE